MGHLCRVCLLWTALGGLGCGVLTGIEPLTGAPPCSDLELPSPVYVTGSDSIVPILEALGPELGDTLQIVYHAQRSCAGARTVLDDQDIAGEVMVWGSTDEPSNCNLEPRKADIGVSDVFVGTCFPDHMESWPDYMPDWDIQGPIGAVFFTAPFDGSSQDSITRTQAHDVYDGTKPLPADAAHEPWTEEATIFRRNPESGTQNMIGAAIGVASTNFRGKIHDSASDMIDAIDGTSADVANRTIGMFDVPTDAVRGNHKRLGYDGEDGSGNGAVWPSAEREGNAQENVRNGTYLLWGPSHMIVRGGPADKPDIQTFTNHVATKPAVNGVLGLEEQRRLLLKIAHARFVPACAMYVERPTKDGEPPVPFTHPKPCHCFYDSVVSNTTCAPCALDADCTAGTCNFGYCEI